MKPKPNEALWLGQSTLTESCETMRHVALWTKGQEFRLSLALDFYFDSWYTNTPSTASIAAKCAQGFTKWLKLCADAGAHFKLRCILYLCVCCTTLPAFSTKPCHVTEGWQRHQQAWFHLNLTSTNQGWRSLKCQASEVEFNLSDGTRAPTGEELVNFSPPPTPWTSLWPLLNLIKQRWTSCWLAVKTQVFFRKLWWNIEKENWTTCPKMKYGPQNICMTQPFILIQVISSLDIMSRYHKMYIVIQWKIRTKLQERRWSCLEECQPRWC